MARLVIDVPDEVVDLWEEEAQIEGLSLTDLIRLRMNVDEAIGETIAEVIDGSLDGMEEEVSQRVRETVRAELESEVARLMRQKMRDQLLEWLHAMSDPPDESP